MINGAINVVAGAITSRRKGSDERNDNGENEEKHDYGWRTERMVERQLR